jgi:hypothetical protein
MEDDMRKEEDDRCDRKIDDGKRKRGRREDAERRWELNNKGEGGWGRAPQSSRVRGRRGGQGTRFACMYIHICVPSESSPAPHTTGVDVTSQTRRRRVGTNKGREKDQNEGKNGTHH